MGKRSIRENKNIYQIFREDAGMTREKAAEAIGYLSPDRIEKIESEKSPIRPEEVLSMSRCYRHPELCNYYCSQECPIGVETVPEIEIKDLSRIVLEVLASLNTMAKEKERLIEISADGRITEDEYKAFMEIRQKLLSISHSVSSLQLWLEKTIADGEIDREDLLAFQGLD